jgi:hypothetical protein
LPDPVMRNRLAVALCVLSLYFPFLVFFLGTTPSFEQTPAEALHVRGDG